MVKVKRVLLRVSAPVRGGATGLQESRHVLLGMWSPHEPLCGSQEQNRNKRGRSHTQVSRYICVGDRL